VEHFEWDSTGNDSFFARIIKCEGYKWKNGCPDFVTLLK